MYNPTIVKHFSEPFFAGELTASTHTVEVGNPVCGDRIQVRLQIERGRVLKARYHAWGCATSLATGDIFCAFVEGKWMADLESTSPEERAALLGELDPAQHHCLDILLALFERLFLLDNVQDQGAA